MKTLNKNDIQNVMDIKNLLSFDTYYTLLNENTNDEQKYKQAKREFIRRQSQLLITDGAEFICGVHKGSFRTNYQWDTINDKGVGRQCDVLPENFTFTDGFQILSIGTWQRIGSTTTFNDEYPLLFRSTIQITGKMPGNNPPETYNLQFTNAGQNFTYEDSIDEAYEQSIMGEEKNNNKQKETEPSADCIVKFSLNENYDNLFGFDSYEISKKNCTDKEKFKNAYKKLEPFREEYLMPWVSLAQYRYIFLKLNIKGKFKEITFNDPKGYFAFEPDTLTSKDQEVKITCNNIIKEKDYKVEVLADGKVAGGLMFVENSIKKLMFPINWYNVVVNPTDLGDIKRLVSKEKIKNYCKKAFTPALIEVEINEITTVIDISKLKNNLYNDIILIKDNSSFLLRPLFLAYLLHYAVTRNPYQISLYTTYIKNENMDKDEHHNGFTWHSKNLKYPSPEAEKFFIDKKIIPTLSLSKEVIEKNIQTNDKEEVCVMFLANDITYLQLDGDIPHELMHALGLEHTFEEKNHPNKEYTFWKDLTNNYMDYNNKKEVTFKWQWDILRSSKYLKILILILTLFLASCRTMSSKEIQAISCVCNDSITQEDKKLPIPPPEKIENDSLKIYVEIQPRNMYLKYIEYLKTNEQKMIYYDLEGNIKQYYFSVPYEFIGRVFIFDEQGNIKKIINHDEGWNVCAFQALAVAKKYAGKNYYHEKLDSPKWQIRKTKLESKDIWVVHYLNKKYKAISLYINKDTGRVVKKVKH